MPSHRHHGEPHTPDIDVSDDVDDFTNRVMKATDLDPSYLDAVLDFLTSEQECAYYVAQTMALARRSGVYRKVMDVVLDAIPFPNDRDTVDSKCCIAFAMGFLSGSSCAVAAVDEGFILDTRGMDEGDDNPGDGIPE